MKTLRTLSVIFFLTLLNVNVVLSQNIPQNPNKIDSKGLRQGKWTITFTSQWQPTTLKDSIKYYRIITYKDGKPQGIVTDYYLSGKKQYEGKMIDDTPKKEIMDGLCIWYYENGNKKEEANYKDGQQQEESIFYDENGNILEAKSEYEKLNDLGIRFINEKKYEEAILTLTQAVVQAKKDSSENSIIYSTALNNLAAAYWWTEQYDKAISLMTTSVNIVGKILGLNTPEYATGLNNLAEVLRARKLYKEAEPLYFEAIRIAEKSDTTNFPAYIQNLGLLYKSQKMYEKAELLYLKAEELYLKQKKADYNVLIANLATLYKEMGKIDKAEKYRNLLQEKINKKQENEITLDELEKIYPKFVDGKYEEVAALIDKYGGALITLYANRNQVEKIIKLLQVSIDCYEKVGKQAEADSLKPRLAELMKDRSNWRKLNDEGAGYIGDGQIDMAFQTLKEAKKIAENEFGKLHIHYATACANFGSVCILKGLYKDAESLLTESKDIAEKVLGKDNLKYATICSQLASLYYNTGAFSKAEPLLTLSKGIYENTNDYEGEKKYHAVLISLGETYRSQGLYDKAESIFIKCKNISSKESLEYAVLCDNLALLYKEQGFFTKAIPLLWEAKDVIKSIYGSKHPDYVISCFNIADLYKTYGNFQVSETLLNEAKNISKDLFGSKNDFYARSLTNLGSLYFSQNLFEKSEISLIEAREIYDFLDLRERKIGIDNDLGLLYGKQGNYTKATNFFIKSVKPRFESLKQNFIHLSEKEKKQYIDANFEHFEKYYFFLTTVLQQEPTYSNLPKLLQVAFDLQLNTKSLLLGETIKMKKRVLSSGNKELIAKFQQWEIIKNLIVKGYNIPVTERTKKGYDVLILEKEANDLEKQLATGSEEFKEAFTPPVYTYLDLQLKLREREAAIEMVRTQFERITMAFVEVGKGIQFDTLGEKGNMRITKIIAQKHSQVGKLSLQANDQILKIDGKATNEQNTKQLQTLMARPTCSVEVLRADGKTKQKFMLHNDSIFIEKKVADTAYLALVLTKKDLFPILLKNGKDLEGKHLKAYKDNTEMKRDNSFAYTAYWSEIAQKLQGINKVYFSPDGVYNLINLNTLQNPLTKKYVIDEIELHQVSNLKDLVSAKKAKNSAQNNTIELVGFPDYQLKAEARLKLVKQQKIKYQATQDYYNNLNKPKDSKRAGVNDLPATKIEVEKVNKLMQSKKWKTKTYLGNQALEEIIKTMKNPKVLHIATHGYFINTDEIPKQVISKVDDLQFRSSVEGKKGKSFEPMLRSGLILAGGSETLNLKAEGKAVSTEVEDGILTAYEAMSLDLDETDLVVLSACETGLGDIQNGEGVYGLQRAFQVAGSKSVLISLWKVADEATQELMTSFYEIWASEKISTREAFKKAQQLLRAKYPHPYYWGAFVMVGE